MQVKKHEHSTEDLNLSLEESISLWMDNEESIDTEQLDSPYGRQLWDSYHLIGDVLRSEELALEPSELFYARITKAIDEEPTVFAPNAIQPSAWRRWSVPVTVLSVLLAVSFWVLQPDSTIEVAPVLASADEMWADYIDAHRAMTGSGPASYVSYVDN